ncbi:hypothetical protein MRX96_059030 [Rhipicephalus microplus]
MAARKPTHAYVQYKDGDSAIVSNRKGYLSESYFRGDILTLGCGIDDLVARIRKQGGTVPEQVFEESYQGTRLKKSTLQETKQVRHHSKVLKKYGKGKILGKRRREDSDSETDEEDELVPRRRLQEAEDEIAELEGRLRVSRERLHEERQRNIKLQNLLEHKIDSMEASIIASVKLELRGTRPASQNWQQESPAVRKKLYQLFARNKDWGPVVPRKGMPVAADPPPSQPSRVLPSSLEEQASSQEAVAASSSSSSTNNKLFRHRTGLGHSVCSMEGTLDNDKTYVVHWNSEQGCSIACITCTSTSWVRDLCVDGDVENNPGPVTCPRTYEEVSGLPFIDWVRDKGGQGTNMLSGALADVGAWADVSPATMLPNGFVCTNVNTATIMHCSHLNPDGRMKSFRDGSWTTVLYPTSVRSTLQQLCFGDIMREDSCGKHVDSAASQKLCSLVDSLSPKAQEGPFPPAQFSPGKAQPNESPSFFAEGSTQENTQTQPPIVVEGASSAAHQRRPATIPEVVVAAVGRSGEVLSSSTAMGQGVAFPLFDVGHYPFLHRPGTVAIVIGKGVPEHGAQSGLTYACRIPITVTQKGIGDTAVVRLGGDIVPECDAVALRALYTKTSPTQMLHDDSRVSLVGEWFPQEGNGTHSISCIRRWGPPLLCLQCLYGCPRRHCPYLHSVGKGTMASLHGEHALVCLTRIVGGLIRPAFPFFRGWQRGQIRFFASVQCVPRGEPYLIMPPCFEMASSFAEAAVYLMSLLPWPWGNMSIVLETGVDGDPTPRKQMYTWYGATTVVPGELCLNVVLHQYPMCSLFGEDAEPPVFALYPTMGPSAVEFWPPFSEIPVNFKPGQNHFVPASAFAASWALGYHWGGHQVCACQDPSLWSLRQCGPLGA